MNLSVRVQKACSNLEESIKRSFELSQASHHLKFSMEHDLQPMMKRARKIQADLLRAQNLLVDKERQMAQSKCEVDEMETWPAVMPTNEIHRYHRAHVYKAWLGAKSQFEP